MKKILVSGSSGFIGKKVVQQFKKQEHTVYSLVRDKRTDHTIYWNPIHEEISLEELEGFDTIVHLAGENIDGRWTKAKKEAIFRSRVRDTWVLCRALSRLKNPPKVFFSASAIGYYGDRGDEILTESNPKGDGFLAEVCAQWEEASKVLESKSRVIWGRFGVVLSPEGGLLAKLLKIFRLGLGGRLGDGKQWMSWITLSDLVEALFFTIENEDKQGVYNFTSPNPVTNAEFTEILAKAVHRKPFLPVPKWALKLMYGREMAEETFLASTRAIPKRLQQEGFKFKNQNLSSVSSCWVV